MTNGFRLDNLKEEETEETPQIASSYSFRRDNSVIGERTYKKYDCDCDPTCQCNSDCSCDGQCGRHCDCHSDCGCHRDCGCNPECQCDGPCRLFM